MKKNLLLILSITSIIAHGQVDLSSNLKLCLSFSGNAFDNSGGSNHGTVSGALLTTDRFGNANSAYSFDRVDDYISVANFGALAPTNELTISMWGKTNQTTSTCLFELINDTPHDRCAGCAQYANGGTTMMIWDYGSIYGNGRSVYQNVPKDTSNWHNYVYMVSQSLNLKKMYLDGVQVFTGPYTGTCFNKSKLLYINSSLDSTNGNIRFGGRIDDVLAYNRALTSAEVSALFANSSVCQTATGLTEIENLQRVVVYPTVSQTGVYTIAKSNGGDFRIDVYTIDGKLIRSMNQKDSELNLAEAENGMYLLRVSDGGRSYIRKVIKN